jgi:hypothetical protein
MHKKLYVTYESSELSSHAEQVCAVAKEIGWHVTDAPRLKEKRESVLQHDAILVLLAWNYAYPAGQAPYELDWDIALKSGKPAAALMVDESADWIPSAVAAGAKYGGLEPFRAKIRPHSASPGFTRQAESVVALAKEQLTVLQERFKTSTGQTFVVWDFSIPGLEMLLHRLARKTPAGVELNIPGLAGKGGAGEIFQDIVLPGIQNNDRVLVITDRPNANVAFEAGMALGFGKKLALLHFGWEVPKWLNESPFRGHLVRAVKNVDEIRETLEDAKSWFDPLEDAPVPEWGGTLFLCPETYIGAALREEREAFDQSWDSVPTTVAVHDLSRRCGNVSHVVWAIAAYAEGSDVRDGTENAANAVIAGWFYARAWKKFGKEAKSRLSVLKQDRTRDVLDILPISSSFDTLDSYSKLLKDVPDQLPKPGPLAVKKIGEVGYEVVRVPDSCDPKHEIWVGAAPVRIREYEEFCKATGCRRPGYLASGKSDPDEPVVEVSANDAEKFCLWLDGSCELPSVKLWAQYSRAGTNTKYWWGDDGSLLAKVAWHLDNSGSHIHRVRTLKENSWGLFDIFGNVWEWTMPEEKEEETNLGPKIIRRASVVGGAYNVAPAGLTQERGPFDAALPQSDVGFRCGTS